METKEAYLTAPAELTPDERRFIERIRRLRKEQCRGALVQFENNGFVIYRLSDRKEA